MMGLQGMQMVVANHSKMIISCTFRYTNLVEDIEYKIYDYNPCAAFSEGDCANVHV